MRGTVNAPPDLAADSGPNGTLSKALFWFPGFCRRVCAGAAKDFIAQYHPPLLLSAQLIPFSTHRATAGRGSNFSQFRLESTMLSRAARPALRAAAAAPTRAAAAAAPAAASFATLREIEDRLKSIRNIEKITKTMKIVASTKLNRAQKTMVDSRAYGQTSNEVYDVAETTSSEAGDSQRGLIIVCSSDKGLCGGVHSGLSRTIRRMFLEKPNYDLVILGEKCRSQLSRTNAKDIVLSFAGIGKAIPTFADAQAVADHIISLPNEYSEVKILYNKFINASSYEPTFVPAFDEAAFSQSPKFFAFEIDQDDILSNMKEFSLANSLYWALAEGHACEISARRNAMDNASKNAGDMIGRYQILFNRTRQAVITGELVEIITGATASADM
ncbi:ATP synthase subunit gamma mitochondrial [Zalerion maritima]|uniref:ATP synthase subunit gamma, mitochondrial n=1 Tax=Zalerion maritima TaxID=339359 RepID=A0AAD5WW09_9PEZI|nr:ATP synthase subunit gamma mitochondrial [Zalerion maritima]